MCMYLPVGLGTKSAGFVASRRPLSLSPSRPGTGDRGDIGSDDGGGRRKLSSIHCFSARAISSPTLSALALSSAFISRSSSDRRLFAQSVWRTPRVPASASKPSGKMAGSAFSTSDLGDLDACNGHGRRDRCLWEAAESTRDDEARPRPRRYPAPGGKVDLPGHETCHTAASMARLDSDYARQRLARVRGRNWGPQGRPRRYRPRQWRRREGRRPRRCPPGATRP